MSIDTSPKPEKRERGLIDSISAPEPNLTGGDGVRTKARRVSDEARRVMRATIALDGDRDGVITDAEIDSAIDRMKPGLPTGSASAALDTVCAVRENSETLRVSGAREAAQRMIDTLRHPTSRAVTALLGEAEGAPLGKTDLPQLTDIVTRGLNDPSLEGLRQALPKRITASNLQSACDRLKAVEERRIHEREPGDDEYEIFDPEYSPTLDMPGREMAGSKPAVSSPRQTASLPKSAIDFSPESVSPGELAAPPSHRQFQEKPRGI